MINNFNLQFENKQINLTKDNAKYLQLAVLETLQDKIITYFKSNVGIKNILKITILAYIKILKNFYLSKMISFSLVDIEKKIKTLNYKENEKQELIKEIRKAWREN